MGFGGKEKRRYPRGEEPFIVTYELSLPQPVILSNDAGEYPAVAMDVSEGGIGLDVDQPLEPLAIVNMRFELINQVTVKEDYKRRLFKLQGEIRHCTMRDKQLYRVGVLFKVISPDERDFIAAYVKDLELKKY